MWVKTTKHLSLCSSASTNLQFTIFQIEGHPPVANEDNNPPKHQPVTDNEDTNPLMHQPVANNDDTNPLRYQPVTDNEDTNRL
jgi:hypothetical protein